MKYILVTGGAGNVGGSLAKALLSKGFFVVVVDNLRTGSMDKLPSMDTENFEFINADVNKYEEISSVFEKFSFEFIFHYAALVGVKRTLDNPIDVLNDIECIKNILSFSKK